jgi:hypothetical protein
MISDKILKDLEDIIDQSVIDLDLPQVTPKSIRIKNCVIRKTKHGQYIVFDIKENKSVAVTNFKYTAIALVKNFIKKRSYKDILELDKDLLKHYNDAVFYKNSIKNSKDVRYIEARQNRLDIAIQETSFIQKKLDKYIFNL